MLGYQSSGRAGAREPFTGALEEDARLWHAVGAIMPVRVIPLDSVRTDGWFERIGEGIGSFQTLCEVIGPRFFAFAMIGGARIVALTIDRRVPDNTLVDFAISADENDGFEAGPQRLPLGEFRRRLVSALITEESSGPAPTRPTDVESIQRHIGVRYLLLAPIFGYSLLALLLDTFGSIVRVRRDGLEEAYEIEEFRSRIRLHVREELQRAQRGSRASIDLSRIADAEHALDQRDYLKVVELLGAWPAPLAVFLRTPEGQGLSPEVRARIARALGLLGSACMALRELEKGHEILRLGIQYAGDTQAAGELFLLLGESMFAEGRHGEAIGLLHRAERLKGDGRRIFPLLSLAYVARGLFVPAYAAANRAFAAGAQATSLEAALRAVEQNLGPALTRWKACCGLT